MMRGSPIWNSFHTIAASFREEGGGGGGGGRGFFSTLQKKIFILLLTHEVASGFIR